MTADRIPVSIQVTASFTADPIAPALEHLLACAGLAPAVRFSPFNQVFQELLDPGSASRTHTGGVNLLLVRLDDLGSEQDADRFLAALRNASSNSAAAAWIVMLPASTGAHASLTHALADEPGIYVIHADDVAALYPVTEIVDATADQLGAVPYTPEYFAALAAAAARAVSAIVQPQRKVIVLDCDNTLWNGVCGETAPASLDITGPWGALQEFMIRQQEAGRLLCLCSKNAESDVLRVFAERPDMPLDLDRVIARRINWETKSSNLRSLAAELQLGLDSFIFVDDNPAECAEVEAGCPEVAVVRLPEAPETIPAFLDHVWSFDLASVTAEDRQRSHLYRANFKRDEFRRERQSFADFIAGLNLEIRIAPATDSEAERIAQLTQRTNQFNVTTKRRTEAEIRTLLHDPAATCLAVRVTDRFGDYGLVGVAISTREAEELAVDTLLLSCRVLGKGVEHALLAELGRRAIEAGCDQVRIPCRPTDRNEPVEKFLRETGAGFIEDGAGEFIVRLPAPHAAGVAFRPDEVRPPAQDGAPSSKEAGVQTGAPALASEAISRLATELRRPADLVAAVREAGRVTRSDEHGEYVAPVTPAETKLAAIWTEVLSVNRIGAGDHFFRLGGTSLGAVRALSRIADDFKVQLPLTALFELPRLADLAAGIERTSAVETTPIIAGNPGEPQLSASQRRLWFLDRFKPGLSAYNIPVAFRLHGPLDEVALQRSLDEITRRHEVFRAAYPDHDGRPVVRIDDHATVTIQHHDLSTTDEAFEKGLALVAEDAAQAFELAQGPLMRAVLVRLSADDHLFVLTLHHIISDGWSMARLVGELSAAYRAFASGGAPDLEPLSLQFTDFSHWQNEGLTQGTWKEQLDFWKEDLAGAPTALDLTTDRPRPPALTYRGGTRRTRFPNELVDALAQCARDHDATLFMLLLSAFQVLLHRYTGQEDILVGTPVAGRPRRETEDLIGCFINTVVLRGDLQGDPTFSAFLDQTRTRALNAFANQDLPFDQLIDELGLSRDLSHSPLFQVMFVLQNTPPDTLALDGLQVESLPVHNAGSKFDLVLEMTEDEDGVATVLEYNRDLFEPDTIDRMLEHLRVLLEGIAHDSARPVSRLPLLTPAESQRVLHDWNPPVPSVAETRPLHRWFEDRVEATPDAVAVTCDGDSLSYAELNARANQLAHFLRDRHAVGPDVMVGICVERSLELVVGLLAILKAGGAYVPIDLAYPAQRLAFILEDCRAPVLLTQRELVPQLPETNAVKVCIDACSDEIHSAGIGNPAPVNTSKDLAYVIYTSGSTGQPKGALVTHENVARLFTETDAWFGFDESDVWTLFHSFAFDFSVWELWGALLYGGRLVVVPYLVSRSPADFYELLSREKVTVLNQTPSAFRQLIQAENDRDETGAGPLPLALRYVVFGGEALEMQSLAPWFDRHGDQQPQLVNMYGITETTVHVTYRPLSADDLTRGSVIGIPIPDLQVYLLDKNCAPVPVGVPGEIYVGGHGLARGYLRRDELTAERFIPHPFSDDPGARLYRTGDLARFLPGRDIEYLGRIDHQVKIRGFRMELGEIESVLCRHEALREAKVVVHEDQPGHKSLAAYLIAADEAHAPSPDDLRQHLKASLPEYMVPAFFVFLDRFPLTNNGKLDTAALPAPTTASREFSGDFVAPRNDREEALAAIWAEVLRLDEVSVTANFFELGGDSILSIQVITRARKAGLDLAPKDLFENQTVAELAGAAGVTEDAGAATVAVVEEDYRENIPLTPIQRWFFEQDDDCWNHYNQAFLFTVAEPLEHDRLAAALQQVAAHHPAFRLRFHRADDPSGWIQRYDAGEASFPLAIHPAGNAKEIERICRETHAALDIEHGPIARAVYFASTGETAPGRLFLCLHHLAVDGVSWQVLREDLEAAYGGDTLPAKSAAFHQWAVGLADYANAPALAEQASYWGATDAPFTSAQSVALPHDHEHGAPNTEASARTVTVELDEGFTTKLLQEVPAAYRTRINDALLTALALAFQRETGQDSLLIDLEGHGREAFPGSVDVARTVGWFTSIYPVQLSAPAGGIGENLKAIKEQLRAVSGNGLGYGVLRYLAGDQPLNDSPQPSIAFNYLGQFDQVVTDSKLFDFAPEPSGSWHHPDAIRRHDLEIDALVRDGKLAFHWSYSENLHREDSVRRVADAFAAALRELVDHCLAADSGGRTPSDFPLATLDQAAVDRLAGTGTEIEDIYPLAPTQLLFYSLKSSPRGQQFDQWHAFLEGPLDADLLERAWATTIERHPILRTTFTSEGLRRPVQVVHRKITPAWTREDWSSPGLDEAAQREKIDALLERDRKRGGDLTSAPLSRFTLVRLAEDRYFLLWSVPDLVMDGWSWPLVFGEVSKTYAHLADHEPLALEPAPKYRDYLRWLARQDESEAAEFWTGYLAGFDAPTPLPFRDEPAQPGRERFVEQTVALNAERTQALSDLCRRAKVTVNSAVQAAWSLVLARLNPGRDDVLFGTAVSGRPTDLPGVESIVGPFVNNLPVRVAVDAAAPIDDLLTGLQDQLFTLSHHQHNNLLQVQDWSEVPWRDRLFNSLLVVQNYQVDDSARSLGAKVAIRDFEGPVHTNFPLAVIAVPADELALSIVCDSTLVRPEDARVLLDALAEYLAKLPSCFEQPAGDLIASLSLPALPENPASASAGVPAPMSYRAPRPGLEESIAAVWRKAFGTERIGAEDNFFDLGGHSLLALRVHARLCDLLDRDLSVTRMFQFPTIRALAEFLEPRAESTTPVNGAAAATAGPAEAQVQDRAARQRAAMARRRKPFASNR